MTEQPYLFPSGAQPAIGLFVSGTPRTQGSGDRMILKRSGPWSRLGAYVDSSDKTLRDKNGVVTRRGGALKRWKGNIASSAKVEMKARDYPIIEDAGVELYLEFHLERPKSVKRLLPHKGLDVDKLARAVLDALKGVAYADDSQVCSLTAKKRYAVDGMPTGVQVCWQEVRHVDFSPHTVPGSDADG